MATDPWRAPMHIVDAFMLFSENVDEDGGGVITTGGDAGAPIARYPMFAPCAMRNLMTSPWPCWVLHRNA